MIYVENILLSVAVEGIQGPGPQICIWGAPSPKSPDLGENPPHTCGFVSKHYDFCMRSIMAGRVI
jgi:hypothetical protein